MAGHGTVGRPEQAARLSKISVILTVIAGAMLLALLVFLYVTVNFEVQQSRTDRGFATVSDDACRELERADAPVGIVNEYTFTLSKELEKDTFLAFYTVHQYAEIYIDGQLREEALERGAWEYLTRPVIGQELWQTVGA